MKRRILKKRRSRQAAWRHKQFKYLKGDHNRWTFEGELMLSGYSDKPIVIRWAEDYGWEVEDE